DVGPGILERLPADLEQQALLRIERSRLGRRDVEEPGVEAADVVEQGGRAHVYAARRVRVGIPPAPQVDAPGWDFRHSVPPRGEHLPEAMRARAAGEPAAHADDGDRVRRPQRSLVSYKGLYLGRGLLQRLNIPLLSCLLRHAGHAPPPPSPIKEARPARTGERTT